MIFTWLDWLPLSLYFLLLIFLTLRKKTKEAETETSFLLSGRKLTLPAFVATLVSTWYGGILGVGEYTFQFGISQWLLFGFPFYVFAILYAVWLASKIRSHAALSIPEAMKTTYGSKAGYAGALGVFLLVNPAPYILMLGFLMKSISGDDAWLLYAIIIAFFSAFYVSFGGFKAVVRTDVLQIVLMYAGFIILLVAAWNTLGSPVVIWEQLPETHRDITGGHPFSYIMVWFFIALWTFVDPGFHQRAAAAESPKTARKGIFVSVGFWAVFDLLTLGTGLYAYALYAGVLENPILAYPEMANQLLPPGLLGLFYTALIAVIMSTLDSFLFLAGQTLGRDVLKPALGYSSGVALTRVGVFVSAIAGIILLMLFPSVIELWYVIGSVIIPVMLIPVLGAFLPLFRLPSSWVVPSMAACFGVASGWLFMGVLTNENLYSYAWLGIEPFYPGLLTGISFWIAGMAYHRIRRKGASGD